MIQEAFTSLAPVQSGWALSELGESFCCTAALHSPELCVCI